MESKHFSKTLLSMGRASLLCFLLLSLCSQALMSPGSSNFTDELALLSFRSTLSSGSSSLLASWNTSIHFCGWPGVVCGRRHPKRVVALLLGSFKLSGGISPFLGNLSFLKELDLHDNRLVGQLPMELGHLRRLQVLIVGKNHLQGSIPVTLGGCTNLKKLDLRDNQLQGEIPNEIGTLSKLVYLDLRGNHLSGEIPRSLADLGSITLLSLYNNRLYGDIPPFWGNLTDLQSLDLADNMLSGAIPSSLGMLPRLSWLHLAMNNLSGLVPSSLWNSSSLTKVSIRQNFLSGTIPPSAFDNVPHLQLLYMDENHFHGPIPASISNASDMRRLQLSWNFFSAIVPPEVGNLRALEFLQISGNLFQIKEPKDWEFLAALRNCSQLYALGLAENKIEGVLPDSISNLSALEYLLLDDNRISGSIPKGISSLNRLQVLLFNNNTMSGSIPEDIGNLINLQELDLSTNFFSGSLPSSLCRLVDMVMFYAYNNNISGSIPLASGNLTGLTYLRLNANAFSGTIPSTLGNLTQLTELGLSSNYLVGTIPATIFNLPALSSTVDLSYNSLEGVLPEEIGNLKNIIEFHAESNKLSGEIPTTIGECLLLQRLFLQNNTLNGSIPLQLGQLRGLDYLDLSSNNFSGQIPKSLGDLRMIYYLNLSFNNFAGEVPNFGVFTNITAISIQGNGKLCGGIPDLHLPTCSLLPKRNHKFPVIPVVISLVTVLVMLAFLWKFLIWHKKRKTKFQLTAPIEGHPMISYGQLVRATDGFSASNLLGSGSFGSVYKGELNGQEYLSTNLVAVKVLKVLTPNALKSFTAECEALRNMRHRNLVKIITICSSIDARGADFKAIVYDFMHNGSLEGWLHPDINDQTEQRYLNLLERVTTLVDVAYALDYLHCHGPEPVVHCDIKSSNVLLDADMVAHVGDFGLAKILVEGNFSLQQSTSSMGFRGTIGYAAPEYGAGNMVSTHGDIYSYGILVLETITGRRPTDRTFRQELSLREYVDLTLQNRIIDAVDPRLSLDLENERPTMGDSSYKIKMDCVFSLLSLGMSCTQESPSSRMPTDGIIKELLAIKDSLLREH